MSEFRIESGLIMPASRSHYPFADMAVGDSFAITDEATAYRARYAAKMYSYRHRQKFRVRRDGAFWRVWRVE